jgi:tRNA-2-methylthio-N6-dimethylallyladenosine synthase
MHAVFLETFGCQMNELDSELVRGQLATLGYRFVNDPAEARVVLFNTCSVREQAEQKAYSRIGIVGKRKAAGETIVLGVIGCMAERDGLDLLRRHPQVDLMCGPAELDRLPQLIDNALRTQSSESAMVLSREERSALAGNRSRRSTTLAAAEDNLEALDLSRAFDEQSVGGARRSAQVRITRGCNKFCTYCVVPATRGAEIHRPPDHIVDECRRLADAGALEITLLGQTVNHYRYEHGLAVTVDGRQAAQVGPGLSAFRGTPPASSRVTTFARLLQRIHDEVPQILRLRFVTSYPRDFGDDVLAVMRDCPRVCKYLHVPAQSGSDRILKLMNRGYSRGEYVDFVQRAIGIVPDVCIAGDIIVGFPTETDEDFEQTCSLVRELPFKNNFIFKYSPRPGTVAIERFADDVPDAIKRLRNNMLLALQSETSRRVHSAWVGRTVGVFFSEVRAPRSNAQRISRETSRDGAEDHSSVVSLPQFLSTNGPTVDLVRELPLESRDSASSQWQAIGRTNGDLICSVSAEHEGLANKMVGNIKMMRIIASEPLLLRSVASPPFD